ncbi:MAG: glycosyltransferase, partial [Methanomassiliicoccales archaeon]|nr:glycosyltransferase [Methanomassiliicoccales archaeon]
MIRTETRTVIMTSTFYPPFHIGGDAVHVKYLAEELVRRGHEVHVLHSVDAYRLKRGGTLPYEDQIGVQVHPVEAPTGRVSPAVTFMTGSNRRAERLLEQLVVKERAAWVHHHHFSLWG